VEGDIKLVDDLFEANEGKSRKIKPTLPDQLKEK
jgi:hypothetical protein